MFESLTKPENPMPAGSMKGACRHSSFAARFQGEKCPFCRVVAADAVGQAFILPVPADLE
jgi:hypothetical protein